MSKAARFTSTSLLALALASWAWGAPADREARLRVAVATVAYVPGGDAVVDAAIVRGLRRAFAEASPEAVPVSLELGRRPRAWSNVAPEAVRLAFERNARVLITPPDRRIAHLMAQVATRVQIPLISTSEAPSMGATGSYWVSVVTRADVAGGEWERVGECAGRHCLTLLQASWLQKRSPGER